MKTRFTYTALLAIVFFSFSGCYKQPPFNEEAYWLSREKGEVVYSDSYCGYYVVQTLNGYTLVRNYGGYKPAEGSIIYGDLSYSGTHDFYNRSYGTIFSGTVTNYWLSYAEAQNAIDYYCPLAKSAQGKMMSDSKSGFRNLP